MTLLLVALLVVLISALVPISQAFPTVALPWTCSSVTHASTTTTALFGMAEWRRRQGSDNDRNNHKNDVLLLPFALDDDALLLPGQTSSPSLVFKEGRFFDLLEEALEDHGSIIGSLLMGDQKHCPVLPLCEITSYQLDAGFRGKVTATVTLQCVARAHLVELTQLQPTMRGVCCEVIEEDDSTDNTMEECEALVQDIEQMLQQQSTTTSTTNDAQSHYQQAFWKTLTALGYQPTDLFTRDPMVTNAQKELQAASWAALQTLADPTQRYHAFAATSVLERLQLVRRALLTQNLEKANENMATCAKRNNNNNNDDGWSSSSSILGTSGFE